MWTEKSTDRWTGSPTTPSLQQWPYLVLTFAVLAAFVAWVLSLPCFPSSDGPVHLYYAHVFGTLLAQSGGRFTGFFRVRHLLPPYALYYYLLLILGRVVDLQTADRLVICLYFAVFATGFRYLGRAIGPAGAPLTVLFLPLLLNWPLGMGFVNFCLSLSMALWAAGLWLRFMGHPGVGRRVLFLVLVAVLTLTHPVPLLLLLVVAAALWAGRLLAGSLRTGRVQLPQQSTADLLTWLLAALSLVYVTLFTVTHPLAQTTDIQPASYWSGVAHGFSGYARGHALAFVLGSGAAVQGYRLGLLLIPLLTGALAIRQRLQNARARTWSDGDTFLVLGLLLAVGLPFIPSKLNGLYYFADRLVICLWLALLLAAAGWQGSRTEAGRWIAAVLALLGTLASAALLLAANRTVRPAAEMVSVLNTVHLPAGQVGFLLEDPRPPLGTARAGASWNPYYWASIGLFRRNDAILANAPWMDETILPITAGPALPEEQIRALQEPLPTHLQDDLLRSAADRAAALHAADFFVVNAADRAPLTGPEPLLVGDEGYWRCSLDVSFRICRKAPAAPARSQ